MKKKKADELMLPWVQGDSTPGHPDGDNAVNIYDADSGGNLIAECLGPKIAEHIIDSVEMREELLDMLKRGEDIISGLEAEADNAGIDLCEVRHWWQDAESLIASAEGKGDTK